MSCALCVDEREVGKLEERYRIIKLLEEAQAKKCKGYECKWPSRVGYDAHDYDCGYELTEQAIKLIKGETNE